MDFISIMYFFYPKQKSSTALRKMRNIGTTAVKDKNSSLNTVCFLWMDPP